MKAVMFFLNALLALHSVFGTVSHNPEDTIFYLYTSENVRNEVVVGDTRSLQTALVRASTQTFLIIDGFLSDSTSPMSVTTKNELLRSHPGANVIVVDWGKLSGSGTTLGNQFQTLDIYLKVLKNVGPMAQRIADFLHFLQTEAQVKFGQVHIIGHSLGAHAAGAVGYWVQEKYGGLISRVSGLDPAGPLFSGQNNVDKRLHKGDAAFVDIYHTNRGTLGDTAHQTGDINVYVNGGDGQPGCEEADQSGFKGYCSHSFSWKLWNTCSQTNGCYACPCSGYNCQCANCSPTCSNGIILGMNLDVTTARGAYYIHTEPLE